jgi:hypothetical protein
MKEKKWSIVDNVHAETPMALGTMCATEGCPNLACVEGRCMGFDCSASRCDECLAKSDLKFHCRKCRLISTGGIVCVSTSPPTLLYYMLSVIDEKTARRYLRSENGRSYTKVNITETFRISTYSRIPGTDTFGINPGPLSPKIPHERLEHQLTALGRLDLPDEDRFQLFVPKISVVEKCILTNIGKLKDQAKQTCEIKSII